MHDATDGIGAVGRSSKNSYDLRWPWAAAEAGGVFELTSSAAEVDGAARRREATAAKER